MINNLYGWKFRERLETCEVVRVVVVVVVLVVVVLEMNKIGTMPIAEV